MWTKLATQAPASVKALHDAVGEQAEAFAESVTFGAGALAALGLPSGSGGHVAERAGLEAMLRGEVSFLAVTPYNSGGRVGEESYLTPQEALAFTQARLAQFSGRAGVAALLLLLPGEDAAHLSAVLAPLCRLYPTAELEQLLRRTGALATLEYDKFVIPEAPLYPPARQASAVEHPKGREAYVLLGAEAAIAEAVAGAGDSPLKKLQALAAKRSSRVDSLASAFNDLASGLEGSFDFYAAYLEGAGLRDLSGLAKSAPAPERYKSCSVLCWWGSPSSLTFLKELFGV